MLATQRRGVEAMDVDAAPSPDWTRIPGDVIGQLLRSGQLDCRDAQRIMGTCTQVRAQWDIEHARHGPHAIAGRTLTLILTTLSQTTHPHASHSGAP